MRVSLFATLSTGFTFLSASNAVAGGGGTILSATKTATVSVTQQTTYDWALQKTIPADQVTFVIPRDSTVPALFTIKATRSVAQVVFQAGAVTGEVCVTNEGYSPTANLTITDILQSSNGTRWQDIRSQGIPVTDEISPGRTRCFPYQFSEQLDPNTKYRNIAEIRIDNYLNREGINWGIDVIKPVTIQTTSTAIDGTATLTDNFQCPTGFTCNFSPLGQTLTGSRTIDYTVTLTNVSAPCGHTLTPKNDATLTEQMSGQIRAASAELSVYTGTCQPGASPTRR